MRHAEPVDLDEGNDPERAIRGALRRGHLTIRLFGARLHGVFSLVRTKPVDDAAKPQWLLIKRDDDAAARGSDITTDATTSIATGRPMDLIADEATRVWHSNRRDRHARRAPKRGR